MPVWQIEIKDMQFKVPEQVEVEKYRPRHVVSNGWECYIKKDNAVSCISTQEYFGVEYKFMFKIFKNGVMAWLRQKGNEEAITLKTVKLEQWPVNGRITLPMGFDNQNNVCSYKEVVRRLLSESCFYTS